MTEPTSPSPPRRTSCSRAPSAVHGLQEPKTTLDRALSRARWATFLGSLRDRVTRSVRAVIQCGYTSLRGLIVDIPPWGTGDAQRIFQHAQEKVQDRNGRLIAVEDVWLALLDECSVRRAFTSLDLSWQALQAELLHRVDLCEEKPPAACSIATHMPPERPIDTVLYRLYNTGLTLAFQAERNHVDVVDVIAACLEEKQNAVAQWLQRRCKRPGDLLLAYSHGRAGTECNGTFSSHTRLQLSLCDDLLSARPLIIEALQDSLGIPRRRANQAVSRLRRRGGLNLGCFHAQEARRLAAKINDYARARGAPLLAVAHPPTKREFWLHRSMSQRANMSSDQFR